MGTMSTGARAGPMAGAAAASGAMHGEGAARAERVAVIVVHGIADQQRGHAAQAVALQLASQTNAEVLRCDVPIGVPPLEPAVGYDQWAPQGLWQRIRESWRQSLRSDFLDCPPDVQAPMAPAEEDEAEGEALRNSAGRASDDAPDAGAVDNGVRFTDYLLAKAHAARGDTPASVTPFNMPCFELRAHGAGEHDGRASTTEVFEVHWADLSRLSGGAARIVTELFTMLFHFSKLGADTVAVADATMPPNALLSWLSGFHRWAHWLFSRGIALLFLQLVVRALLLVPAAQLAGHERGIGVSAAVLVGAALGAWRVFRGHNWRVAAVWGLGGGV